MKKDRLKASNTVFNSAKSMRTVLALVIVAILVATSNQADVLDYDKVYFSQFTAFQGDTKFQNSQIITQVSSNANPTLVYSKSLYFAFKNADSKTQFAKFSPDSQVLNVSSHSFESFGGFLATHESTAYVAHSDDTSSVTVSRVSLNTLEFTEVKNFSSIQSVYVFGEFVFLITKNATNFLELVRIDATSDNKVVVLASFAPTETIMFPVKQQAGANRFVVFTRGTAWYYAVLSTENENIIKWLSFNVWSNDNWSFVNV